MKFLKVFIKFVLGVLFYKDEYSIRSKYFNPLKTIIVLALVLNVFFTIYLFKTLISVHDKIDYVCLSDNKEQKEKDQKGD